MSISGKPRGALWPTEASRPGVSHATTIAIVAALAIEGALIAAAMSMRVPTSHPPPVTPVMQIRFVKAETPPPPAPPPPVIKKIVKRQSEAPAPKPVARPATPAQRHVAAPTAAPVPVATQEAPSHAQAAPGMPAPVAAPAATPGPRTAAPAEQADIAIVCPVQARPEAPARALAEGIVGSVTARATIKGGKVIRVDIVKSTPPGVFDASIRRAMAQYQCKVDGDGQVVVEQSFDFTEAN
jgi:outer membrane biosynthesis protein TonB